MSTDIGPGYPGRALHASEKRSDNDSHDLSGSEILDQVMAILGQYVVYPNEHSKVAHALWIAHTHAIEAWDVTPRLAFLSPEPASGKTRALELTRLLVANGRLCGSTTASFMFRSSTDHEGRLTLLLDEVDTIFSGPATRGTEEIRGVINMGYTRGNKVGRVDKTRSGMVAREYDPFCPVAVAGLRGLPDTIATRSIIIPMRRRTGGEVAAPFRQREVTQQAEPVRAALEVWIVSRIAALRDMRPDIPDGVRDRSADIWEPLLAIADAAGGNWPEYARVACVAVVAASRQKIKSLGELLLTDIRSVFMDERRMTTENLIRALRDHPSGLWEERDLNAHVLSRTLREFDIGPKSIRTEAGTKQGYDRVDFTDAWRRYADGAARVD